MASFWENIQVGGSTLDVYVSLPDEAGPSPAIVVNHHGGGVDRLRRRTILAADCRVLPYSSQLRRQL